MRYDHLIALVVQRLDKEGRKVIVSQNHIHLHVTLSKSTQLINKRIMNQNDTDHQWNLNQMSLPFQTRSSFSQRCTFAFPAAPAC